MTQVARLPLSRDRVAAAALDLIDECGLQALSMRKLGASMGFEAMSLYNHIDNKDDLLGAVADLLFGEILDAYGEPEGDWRAKARAMTSAYVSVADAHTAAVTLLVERPVQSPQGLDFLGQVMSIFEEVSVDIRTAALAFTAVSNWVIGTVIQEHGAMRGLHAGEGPSAADIAPEYLPILRFREVCVSDLSVEERFSEGLETVLDGVESRYFSH